MQTITAKILRETRSSAHLFAETAETANTALQRTSKGEEKKRDAPPSKKILPLSITTIITKTSISANEYSRTKQIDSTQRAIPKALGYSHDYLDLPVRHHPLYLVHIDGRAHRRLKSTQGMTQLLD